MNHHIQPHECQIHCALSYLESLKKGGMHLGPPQIFAFDWLMLFLNSPGDTHIKVGLSTTELRYGRFYVWLPVKKTSFQALDFRTMICPPQQH
jgi:hypothetical protein